MIVTKEIPNYNKVHLKFKLNSGNYQFEDLYDVAYSFIKEGQPYEKVFGYFLMEWLDPKDYIELNTSGSTGMPKTIRIKKQSMVNSAIATGDFFNLKPGDKALLCLPTDFIAGKMMLVRAMILGLELDVINPSATPDFNRSKQYDFCAMIPMQLQNAVGYIDNIKNIIVGGAKPSPQLIESISQSPAHVYEAYGMTETVSHIALKKLNNFSSNDVGITKRFNLLPNIKITQDERGCLIIDAPHLSEERVVTNDMVKIYSEKQFNWIGRYDNVINTGGIKVFPEQIEDKIQDKIPQRFFITSMPDDTLGEKVVLVLESDSNLIDKAAFESLEKYETPKEIFAVEQFAETASGKIQRKQTLLKLK